MAKRTNSSGLQAFLGERKARLVLESWVGELEAAIRAWDDARKASADATVNPIIRHPGEIVTEEEMAEINRTHFALMQAEGYLRMLVDR